MHKEITISRSTRRQFIKYGAMAAGAVVLTGPYPVRGQNLNSKLNLAQIGCGSKGSGDIGILVGAGENFVAVCDVHASAAAKTKRNANEANVYADYRELFEKEKNLDAIDIATPDHMHAVIAATAIKMGKHVYCQKPLTHDVYEARMLRDLAREHNVATQMGNQGSASDSLRRAVEVMHAGIIGPVKTAYVWTNRPIWPQGKDRPPGSDPIPEGLNWDLWLGTAPERPFKANWPDTPAPEGAAAGAPRRRGRGNVYHPFSWRGWQDFGTGALGDMACHTVNWPFRALKLGYPTEIEATSSGMNTEMYPSNSRIRFEFPARDGMPAVTLHWSDGGNKPPAEVTADVEAVLGRISNSGCMMIGENGVIFSPDDGDQELKTFLKLKGDTEMVGLNNHASAKTIPQTVPRNATTGSPDERQHKEWLQAIKDGKHSVPYSNFDIAAYLTEIILLGCVALRVGKKLEWDGPGMKAKNAPEAARFVKREYRKPGVV